MVGGNVKIVLEALYAAGLRQCFNVLRTVFLPCFGVSVCAEYQACPNVCRVGLAALRFSPR